jgi:acyl-CoA dehydrogenase family member 9
MNSPTREEQMAQAEEILGQRLSQTGFAKGLFFGQYLADQLPPYPAIESSGKDVEDDGRQRSERRATGEWELVTRLRDFCRQRIDPRAIDQDAEIPRSVVTGLGELGILGACLPKSCGGLELTQTQYCQLLEVLGGHCGSTALFVNAHHSIGPRAIVLFGTAEQQQRWLPKLATGEWLSAFALTEPEAGSDAANVQTTATPTEDGRGYILSGEKRWITNGGLAQVLTVMARTPTDDSRKSAITAFLVTPDLPGFQVLEARMEKCGVRGTVTSRLRFENMFVPRENLLGAPGKGLRIALTVLDFGRTTFGASCTGAAKFCLEKAKRHVHERVQFGQPLAAFELVREKIANMEAHVFAMEACTYQTAALIDSGKAEFMIETAMLKVFTTERLWEVIYDTFQLFGGRAYFCDEPYERLMRDARINSIGEGANDVLRVFSALVGMREVGMELEGVLQAVQKPMGNFSRLARFVGRTMSNYLIGPEVISRSPELEPECARLAHDIGGLGRAVVHQLRVHQREIVDRQLQVARISDAATEIYVSAAVIRRLDHLLRHPLANRDDQLRALTAGRYYLRMANRRIRRWLAALNDNDDSDMLELARRALG